MGCSCLVSTGSLPYGYSLGHWSGHHKRKSKAQDPTLIFTSLQLHTALEKVSGLEPHCPSSVPGSRLSIQNTFPFKENTGTATYPMSHWASDFSRFVHPCKEYLVYSILSAGTEFSPPSQRLIREQRRLLPRVLLGNV